jgi:hypothetical protein
MNTIATTLFSIVYSIIGITLVSIVPVSLILIVVYLIKIYNVLKKSKREDVR